MRIKFEYLDNNLKKKSAVLDFNNKKHFYDYLKEEKYTLFKYKEIFFKKDRGKSKDIKNFISSLYFLIKANINILDALVIIKENFPNKFKENISKTISHLKKGKNLKDSFIFISNDEIFLNTLKIGEESGNIIDALENLKEKYEFEHEIKKEIINLSMYPILVLSTSIIIVSILFKFIVPKFSAIYQDLDKEIPKLTNIIMKFGVFYERHLFYIIVITSVILAFAMYYYKKNKSKYESLILKLPFINKLYLEIQVLSFTQNMHILTNGGLDILTSLELSKYSVGFVLKQEISALKKKLEKGISLKESFNSSSFFNIEYKNYITIGEETGDLNFIFSHIKNIYLIRIKEKIKRFLKILEPVSIIFIALIIGVIIFSIMLPIFKLGENIDL